MTSSREDSPDWLHNFKAPTVTLSDDSDASPSSSPRDSNADDTIGDNSAQSPSLNVSIDVSPENGTKKKRKRKKIEGDEVDGQVAEEIPSKKHTEPSTAVQSIWALSSDSESDGIAKCEREKSLLDESELDEDTIIVGSSKKSPKKKVLKEKSPKKRAKKEEKTPEKERKINEEIQTTGADGDLDAEFMEEQASEKHERPQVSSSRLPLVLSDKVQRSKALVECEGDSIDLSGDMGAVGRVIIQDSPAGDNEMYLDLKGTVYKATIVPSRTFCIVSFGQTEAKIEAIMNDFIQLKPQSNINEVETMVEGTLEGFSFDSEDEADKMSKHISNQVDDQNEGPSDQTNGKTKKSSGSAQKKGKAAVKKPQPAKKARKKPQAPKKSKAKK